MQVAETAGSLQPEQLPLVLWALATLGHHPPPGVLHVLEAQACRTSSQLTAQVGFCCSSSGGGHGIVLTVSLYFCLSSCWCMHWSQAPMSLHAYNQHLWHRLCTQGVSLVLSSCQALGHRPEAASLACLEAAMRAGLPRYKRAELAACLEAFKAWGYCPSSNLLQARSCSLCMCSETSLCVVGKRMDAFEAGGQSPGLPSALLAGNCAARGRAAE